jgi:hypothetical protein
MTERTTLYQNRADRNSTNRYEFFLCLDGRDFLLYRDNSSGIFDTRNSWIALSTALPAVASNVKIDPLFDH